jgi:hypothetical protein
MDRPLEDFGSYFSKARGKTLHQSWCRECNRAHSRNNPRSKENSRKHHLKKFYGLSVEQYEELAKDGCNVCGSKEDLCVDHDHSCCPGRNSCGFCIRGILCGRHNKAEGLLRGDPEDAEALMIYMRNNRSVNAVREVMGYYNNSVRSQEQA